MTEIIFQKSGMYRIKNNPIGRICLTRNQRAKIS